MSYPLPRTCPGAGLQRAQGNPDRIGKSSASAPRLWLGQIQDEVDANAGIALGVGTEIEY
jgi:hypothetical protein